MRHYLLTSPMWCFNFVLIERRRQQNRKSSQLFCSLFVDIVYVMIQLRLDWVKTWICERRLNYDKIEILLSSFVHYMLMCWQNRKSSQFFCSLYVDVCIVYVMFQLRLDWDIICWRLLCDVLTSSWLREDLDMTK